MIDKKLDNGLVKFPAFRARIIELLSSHDEFRTLCEDYWQCRESIARIEFESRSVDAAQRQFADLSLTLEKEMMRILQVSS